MAGAAKKLIKEKGMLSTPYPKPGRSVAETIVEQVKKFYEIGGCVCVCVSPIVCVCVCVSQ